MGDHGQVITILILGMALAAPVVWAALGELVAEQAGIINPGIEGIMLGAALVATIAYYHSGSLVVATLAAIGLGIVCGVLLSYLFVTRGANQIITGILFNLLALGATTTIFVQEEYLSRARVEIAPDHSLPVLGDIPGLGPVFFEQDVYVYGSYAAVLLVFYLMRHTWLGLSMRAAGEHPKAVEAAGLNVWRVRHVATIIGCVLPAIGGAVLVVAIVGGFNAGMTAGQGFIALGVVVLARWNPFAAFAGALLFGVAQALQFEAQNIGFLSGVPTEFLLAIPYVVTILAVVFARGSEYPTAAAAPYPPPRRQRLALPRPASLLPRAGRG